MRLLVRDYEVYVVSVDGDEFGLVADGFVGEAYAPRVSYRKERVFILSARAFVQKVGYPSLERDVDDAGYLELFREDNDAHGVGIYLKRSFCGG